MRSGLPAPRRARACRQVLIFSLLILTIFAAGCAPSVVFLGDSALQASLADLALFRESMERAATDAGHRLSLEWDPSTELATAWLEQQLDSAPAPIVVLSPYFSLFASDLANRYPDLSLIAFGGTGADQDNLTRVVFDRIPALERAGAMLREWVSADPERKAAALHLASSDTSRAQADALMAGFGGEGSDALILRSFDRAPERENVRSVVRELRANGVNAYLVFIGSSNRFALELLQTEPVVFATDIAMGLPSLDDALLFSVEDPLEDALETALAAIGLGAGGQTVPTESKVVAGSGFEDPQLHEPPEGPLEGPLEGE